MLYVFTGDGGIGGTDASKNQAQSESSPWGKVLRVDPSGGRRRDRRARHAQPVHQHLVRRPARDRRRRRRLRLRLGRDQPDAASGPRTGPIPNFGWNTWRGPCWAFATDLAECAGYTDPIHGYRKDDPLLEDDPFTRRRVRRLARPRDGGDHRAGLLGSRYDGFLDDVLIYADFVQGWVRGALLSQDGRVLADRFLLHYGGLIPNLTRGPDGYLYLLGNDQGHMEIQRLTGPNVEPPPPPPEDGPPLVDHPTDPRPVSLEDRLLPCVPRPHAARARHRVRAELPAVERRREGALPALPRRHVGRHQRPGALDVPGRHALRQALRLRPDDRRTPRGRDARHPEARPPAGSTARTCGTTRRPRPSSPTASRSRSRWRTRTPPCRRASPTRCRHGAVPHVPRAPAGRGDRLRAGAAADQCVARPREARRPRHAAARVVADGRRGRLAGGLGAATCTRTARIATPTRAACPRRSASASSTVSPTA